MNDRIEITGKSWLMIATLGVIWGGSFLGNEIALKGITPVWIAAGRLITAAAVVLVILRLQRQPVPVETLRQNWLVLLILGLLSATIPFFLLAWGQQFVTSGFAGVSMASVPLLLLPLAHVFLPGEQMTRRRVTGFCVGFLGVAVLIGGQAFDPSGAAQEWAGRFACLAAASCYAVSSILTRRFPPIDPIMLTGVLAVIAATAATLAALVLEGLPPMPSAKPIFALLMLGVVSTGIANIIRVIIIRSAGSTFMTLTSYQIPVWSVIFGIVLLDEPVGISLFLALLLILIGVLMSQWGAVSKLLTRLRQPHG